MIKNRKRLWALFLSAALIVTQLPAVAMAESNSPEDGSIASFEELPSGVANQSVDVGSELSALNPGEDNTDESDDTVTASPSNAENSVSEGNAGDSSDKDSGKTVTTVTTSEEEVPVTWDSEPAYDGDTEDSYALSDGAKLPQIAVTVATDAVENPVENPTGEPLSCTQTEGCTLEDGHEGECVTEQPPANDSLVKTITGWTFVATDYSDYAGGELTLPIVNMEQQADFDTVFSMLPTQISAEIENEADPATVDITGWDCREYIKDGEGNWPLTGKYTFTAELPEGYACEPLPAVKVTLGGAQIYAAAITGDGYSFDQLSGNLTISSYAGTTNWRNNTSINKADVLSLTISDTMTSIGNNAFSGCTGLTSIDNLPAGLTSIGKSTFWNCTGLTSIGNLPAGLKSIGDYTFSGCTGLTSIDNLPAGLTNIGDYTFSDCTGLTSIDNLPAGLKSIGNNTFSGCTGLTSMNNLPAGLKSIGDYTFSGCTGLTSIDNLPAGLKSIGDYTFSGCTGLTSIDNLPAGLTSIGNNTFSGCTGLTSIDNLPAGLKSIGNSTFSGCTGLTSIDNLPAGLKSIGSYTFRNCTGLTSIDNLPAGLTSIGGATFSYCTGLTSIDNLPAGLTSIGDYMFDGCTGLTEIIIPEGVTSIGGWALSGCTNLKTIVFLRKQAPTFGTAVIPSISPAPVVYVPEGAGGYESLSVQTVTMTAPAIAAQPQDVAVTAGITATFTVKADSALPPSYQWQVNTGSGWSFVTDGTGGNTDSYTTPATNVGMNGWQYRCVIANAARTVTTSTATLKILTLGNAEMPAITVKKESSNTGGNGVSSPYTEPEPQSIYTVTGEIISLSVSRSDLKKLADDRKSLTLGCDKAGMTFDPAALKAILAAVPSTAGSITFTAAPADLSAFPDAAKLIGFRPVYNFTISYKDSLGNPVTVPVNFPAGSAAITLTYTPAAAEVLENLFMVYVDSKGALTWLDKSSYVEGRVLADAPHFSTYGVAYKTLVPVFTDIAGHWAKEDIEFVAARGLLSGTGKTTFSPDTAVTRGMFVTALGRLAGIDPASYQTRSFTDVKADAYYAAYVEWAAQKNIAKGTGDKLFSPDTPVTREQMAVMMTNYAGQMGYSIPTPLAAAAFEDNDKISTWAAKEAAAMQRAGFIKGKDGNRFDPQGNATRAEVSAVLRRFVEIVIDPATATGWVKNDSGHWLYYKDGKALTGWQTIGKLRYYFNGDGVMHEGWKRDTDTNKWYYWTSAGAATGWWEIGGKWYYFDENGVMAVQTSSCR